jgi:predicted GNAT family acetyltransferase
VFASHAPHLFQHTETPTRLINPTYSRLQGKGIAGVIVKEAVEHVKSKGGKVIASCSYVARWFEKNPGYKDVLVKNDVGEVERDCKDC